MTKQRDLFQTPIKVEIYTPKPIPSIINFDRKFWENAWTPFDSAYCLDATESIPHGGHAGFEEVNGDVFISATCVSRRWQYEHGVAGY
jgi:hypothetical protein